MVVRSICLVGILFSALSAQAAALNVNLGTAGTFGVLAGQTVTNTGPTFIDGNLGVSPGSAITGFPPGLVSGAIHQADAVALQAQTDLTTAYNMAASQVCDTDLSGQNLGNLSGAVTPGVYCFTSSAQLTGTLTLDAQGDPNSVFLFKIDSMLTTANGAVVAFINGGDGDTLFFQVGSSATLGANTSFAGNILALTSITMNTGASIDCGRALAQTGSVTLDSNRVSGDTRGCDAGTTTSAVPEPNTAIMLSTGLLFGLVLSVRKLRTTPSESPVVGWRSLSKGFSKRK